MKEKNVKTVCAWVTDAIYDDTLRSVDFCSEVRLLILGKSSAKFGNLSTLARYLAVTRPFILSPPGLR